MSFNREFYRDTEKGKIAGVCAGLAEYFGWEIWLVRILFVSGFLLSGSFFFLVYVLGWFILDPKNAKPSGKSKQAPIQTRGKGWVSQSEEEVKVEVKSKVWQAGEPPKQAFRDIQGQFGKLELRLRKMESYVTSSEFQLNREIGRL